LAKELASRGFGQRASFGGYVRHIAASRGVPDERGYLQELGQQLLAELGPAEFTNQALAGLGGDLVVDGVRHVSVNRALAARAQRYLLVFVEIGPEARLRRLRERGADDDLATLDAHSTEREVPLLRQHADLVVVGDDPESWKLVAARLDQL
jgi:hypothetical protein